MSLMEMFADPALFESLSMGEKMLGSFITMCMGMGITFLILLLLWLIIAIMNKVMNTGGKEQVAAPPADRAAAPVASAKDDGVLIAVIAAAVATASGTSVNNLVVRKISRVTGDLPSWAVAGTADCIESRRF